jgi:putative transposase
MKVLCQDLTPLLPCDEAIRKAYLDYGYSMAAIARHAALHYSTVSKVIKGVR